MSYPKYPLTIPQQNIWNLQKYYPDTAIANLCGAVFYREKRREDLLEQAINQVIRSQSGLRMRFSEENGQPVQAVNEFVYEKIPVQEFSSYEEFEAYAGKAAAVPIGLTDRKMYRFEILRVEGVNGVLVVLSHLVSDAWTFSLVGKGIDKAYRELAAGQMTSDKTYDYTDYIKAETEYLKSPKFEKDERFWREKYGKKPEPAFVKAGSGQTACIEANRYSRKLALSVAQRIREFSRNTGITEAVLFETAFGIYLFRLNPENRTITMGIPVLNRRNVREKNTIGMFISTLPLTVEISCEDTVLQAAKKITLEHGSLFRHQKYPYSKILENIRENHEFSGSLYEVMVSYQNARMDEESDTKWFGNGYSEAPFVFHIDNRDKGDTFTITVDYQIRRFRQAEEICLIVDRLEHILQQMTENGERLIGEISILPEREEKRILLDFNRTFGEYPRELCVHQLFTEQAKREPEKTALVFEDKSFSYRELEEMSNSLAFLLRENGIGPNRIVPILAKRSWHVIVAMLGILKAGGAFMFIDPDYPKDRINYMISEVNARCVLTYGFRGEIETEYIIDLNQIDYKKNPAAVPNQNCTGDLCYVIFTSGSTGLPKAALISHENLGNFIHNNGKNIYQKELIDTCKCVLSITTYLFDIFIFELYVPLLNGLSVVMLKDITNVSQMTSLIERYNVDALHITPTRLAILLQNRQFQKVIKNIRLLMLGAEALTYEFYQKVSEYTDAVIYNGYGPTETTIGCSFKRLDKRQNMIGTTPNITIGKPIANTQIYILDREKRILPIGVPGQLCVAGACVGKGYLNQDNLTSKRFIANPFSTKENRHGSIMYCTGDLACWREDGEIEYLGRMDTQVKIRGLRIELGEIESALNHFPAIQISTVTEKRDEDNRQYLVGYYLSDSEIDIKELRRYLSRNLPQYMIPNYFMRLEIMPMTASGKIDRKNLPLPDFKNQTEQFMEPTTDFEIRLARIWRKLLHIENIGKYDDFFELGGDSLLAISMLNEIQTEFHVEISMKDIMEKSSLEELAKYAGYAPGLNQITAEHEERYILLPQQKAIYAACSKRPGTLLYNIPTKIRLSETVDFIKLRQSIQKAFDLHRILKSRIQVEENEIYGIYDKDIEIEIEEYRSGEEAGFIKAFDLEKGPLVRIGFTKEALLFDIHHIIADGSSVKILLQNIVDIYEGKQPEKSELEFSDYAKYFYKLDTAEHKTYFKNMMCCDLEPVVLPKTKKKGQGGRSKEYTIPEEIFWKARKYARNHNMTETMVFLAAYGILLSKYTGKEEIISSIILQNRIHAETQNLVGMFVNTLPVFLQVKGNVFEYMNKVRELLLNLYRYQEIPFWDIANTIGMEDKSIINTSFVYQSDGEKVLTLDGRKFRPQFIDTHTAKFDLSVELVPLEKECRLRMEYSLGKFDENLADAMVSAYILILSQLEKERVSDITILSEAEYHRLIDEFNNTYTVYPKTKCIHECFSEQVKKTPDKIALVFEDKRFTYTQLDKMSNSLAYFLREKGVKPNEVVPIIAKRSWHMVVAMLGVLKAGGAYMPVAPDYPVDRIETMLKIAESRIALLFGFEKQLRAETIELKDFNFAYREYEIKNVNHSGDTAYVIFTSGSTGTPKGISLCHRNVCNYTNNNNNNVCRKIITNQYESIVSVTNIVFDIFVTESILPLLNGLCIYLANEMESMTQTGLSRLLEKNQADVLQTTPTKMKNFILDKTNVAFLYGIRAIVLGGEVFPKDLYQELRSCTNAKIYNIYGPAETTVWSTNKLVESDRDITIGKPIANTQIYILDKDSNPLPIGVPGELCIAGDGVGKGYLNRPKLTAERFVPNPFATAENRHGKVMYRTGDLACWLENGELQYLGRIDTQVKIRGLRIELGEIESVMSQIAGVRMAAVADKRDRDKRQYLVGYYVADEELDGKELRRQLGRSLPKYMIPHYFVRLKALPMTPSGKIDRKNLPLLDFTARTGAYTAPVTEKEKRLCEILEQILGIERIGAEDDFFELGFDSLKAIELVAKTHQAGIAISLQQVFDYPTARQLCRQTEGEKKEKVLYKSSDFESFRPFLERNGTGGDFRPGKRDLGNVLLTGATGFLGAHILDALMKEETGKVYCVVRSGIEGNGEKRLKERLKYYFGSAYEKEFGKRIIPVSGDLGQEDFLDKPLGDIQTVIHSAASVKHYGPYAYFYRSNVLATDHIVKFAKSAGARLIHLSTLSVSGNSMADEFGGYRSQEEIEFDETSFFVGQPLDNVYIRSKFEAERKVFLAMTEGLEARIIRVGNLTNRFSDFKFQPNYKENAFLTRVKAVLELGCFPDYLLPLYAEFSPVDLTAEGVVKIVQYGEKQWVFHLNSDRPVYFNRMMEIMDKLGISMKILDREAFGRELGRTLKYAGTEYIFEALQNDMDTDGNLVYDSNIRIKNDATVRFLKSVGFEWKEIDYEYLRGYVAYFRNLGYLEAGNEK